jgi:peptidoglycan/LPS O-acetylase OafA/YrhL
LNTDNRIKTLDSFRFIAILSVMLFHYYSYWFPPNRSFSYYPYGNSYDYFSLGYLGVEFFFIISGFVIAFTLTRTNSFVEFCKKRLIRLLPSIFICSLITLLIFRIFDTRNLIPKSHSIYNFLISITLISPAILNKIFSHLNINVAYINGSYWSLWPEIQFYFISGFLYFINKKNFLRNIVFFSQSVFWINFFVLILLVNVQSANTFHLNLDIEFIDFYRGLTRNFFNYLYYSLFFLIGVLFFQLYSNINRTKSIVYIILSFLSLIVYDICLKDDNIFSILIIGIMILFFVLFILHSRVLKFLTIKPFTQIGVASYSLYLIHEPIGILLINNYASLFGKYDFIFPIFVIMLMIVFSLFSYKYLERPVGNYLKKKFIL